MSEDTSKVSVSQPLDLPLSEEQMKFLRNPWAVDYETIFYVWAVEFNNAKGTQLSAQLAHTLGVPVEVTASMARSSLNDLRLARWLGRTIGLPPPKDKIFWSKEELDKEKLSRGMTLFDEVIKKDDVIGQAWGFYKAYMLLYVLQNPEFCGRVDVDILDKGNTDPEILKFRIEHAKIGTGLSRYDLDTMDLLHDVVKPLWQGGKTLSQSDLAAWFDQHNSENKEKLEALRNEQAAKEKDLETRFRQYLKSKEESSENSKEQEIVSDSQDNNKEQKGTNTKMATKKSESTELTTNEDQKKSSKKVEFKNVQVMYVDDPSSPRISIPKGMTFAQAREWLTKIETEENRKFSFMYKFKGWYPFDAMWAVYRALAELYGFVHIGDFKGMFGPVPPVSITIETDYNTKQQIPWGPIEVHQLSAPLEPNIDFDQGLPCLTLTAMIKNHERTKVDELMERAEQLLKTDSIYRGKAIEIDFTIFSPGDINFDIQRAPKFMDTNVKETDLILPKETHDLVETGVWTPIRNTQACREHKIPLRRGILLAGKYGVGKTLAARVTAMLCEQHNWTFLYLKDLEQLPQALYFAKRYEPCVVFAEDINRVVSGDRTAEMDKLFNTVDGIDRKNDEVMIVFTTNDLDEIHPAMLRPGRIDAVITVTPPDAAAAAALVRHYGRTIVDPNANLEGVGKLLAGQIPAIIREAVERSKLAAIKDTAPGQELVVRDRHLEIAARQMLEHAKLLEQPEPPKPDLVIAFEKFGEIVANGMRYSKDYDNDDGSKESDRHIAKDAVREVMDAAGRPSTKNGSTEKV